MNREYGTKSLVAAGAVGPAESAMQSPQLGRFIWLLPVAFVLHDGEEVLTMASWIQNNRDALRQVAALGGVGSLAVRNLPASMAEVAGAVMFELIIIIAATGLLASRNGKGIGLIFYAAILGGFSLHVLTHLMQTVWFGGYTPGIVTAIFLIPAVSVYLYQRLFRAALLSYTTALRLAVAGGLLLLPVVLLAHFVGRMLL